LWQIIGDGGKGKWQEPAEQAVSAERPCEILVRSKKGKKGKGRQPDLSTPARKRRQQVQPRNALLSYCPSFF
jgi:hypothetical protein